MEIQPRTQTNTVSSEEQRLLGIQSGSAPLQDSFLTTLQELNSTKAEKAGKVNLGDLKCKESFKVGKLPPLVAVEIRRRMFDTDKEGEQNNLLRERSEEEMVYERPPSRYVNSIF